MYFILIFCLHVDFRVFNGSRFELIAFFQLCLEVRGGLACDLRLLDFIMSIMESCGGLETHETNVYGDQRNIRRETSQRLL